MWVMPDNEVQSNAIEVWGNQGWFIGSFHLIRDLGD